MKSYQDTVFIHIPRTSGIALKWTLNSKIQDLEYINANYHKTAIERREEIGQELWSKCYKFTIVRNPWDRVVSLYHRDSPALSFDEWLFTINTEQTHYFMDDDRIIIDDIFQYETLDHHLEELCRKAKWPLLDRKLKVNDTIHKPYQTYYTQETRKYVADQCCRLITMFDYIY